MVHDGVNWRKMTRRAALLLAAAVLPFALPGNSAVHAQSIMRTPSLHIDSRIPSINPTVAPRINPTIAGRTGVGVNAVAIARTPPPRVGGTTSIMRIDRPVGVGSGTPYLRYSPNLYPVCEYANRGPDGECFDRPVNLVGSGGGGGVATKKAAADRRVIRRPPRPICARCRTNSWPRSTARCRLRTPTHWRAAMGWSGLRRRIFRWSAAPSACSASSTAGRRTRCGRSSRLIPG